MQYLKYSIQLSFLSEEVKSFVDGLLVSLFRTHDGFFRYIFTFSLSSQQTRELRSFFTYITLSFTPEQIACTPAVFTFNFCIFFILFLFVCLPGGSYECKVNEFKQSKQTKKRTKRTRYVFFLPCFLNLPRSPKETKNAPMHYSMNNKKLFGQNLRRPCWLC